MLEDVHVFVAQRMKLEPDVIMARIPGVDYVGTACKGPNDDFSWKAGCTIAALRSLIEVPDRLFIKHLYSTGADLWKAIRYRLTHRGSRIVILARGWMWTWLYEAKIRFTTPLHRSDAAWITYERIVETGDVAII